ncbi:hypothetical protein J6590_011775 [Homalodisca vitripennis]|nr:hypothetical protein J6590_011775 [Homalodisca vitripennis]
MSGTVLDVPAWLQHSRSVDSVLNVLVMLSQQSSVDIQQVRAPRGIGSKLVSCQSKCRRRSVV